MKNLGIYIHIPFCKKKCEYCDFVSFSGTQNMQKEYVEVLNLDIKNSAKLVSDYKVDTIYFGGGTPSYIESKYIVDILKSIKDNYKVAKNAEITIEVNPGTVDKEKLMVYKEAGINRLSIGLQSTHDRLLELIG